MVLFSILTEIKQSSFFNAVSNMVVFSKNGVFKCIRLTVQILLFLINNTAYEKVLILLQQFELLNFTD